MKHALALVSFSVLSMTLLGCKPDAAIRQGEPVGAGSSVALNAPNPATLGTVAGTVKISGKVPAPVRIDMSQDPACTLGDAQNFSEQIVAQKGNLANVYIYIQNAPSVPAPANMQPVVINQKGCRFTPHVAAVMQGGTVQFTNSDPTMHNVHTMPVQAGNRTVDV